LFSEILRNSDVWQEEAGKPIVALNVINNGATSMWVIEDGWKIVDML
jgi:hypothetical protein